MLENIVNQGWSFYFCFAEKPTFILVKKQASAFRRQKSAGEHNAETRDIVYSKTNFGERESCTLT